MDQPSSGNARILVLEPSDDVASAILDALRETAPDTPVKRARSLEEAQGMATGDALELFVLDVDATYDLGQEFLYDLRTSHPNARAIILTATHLSTARERTQGIGAIHFLEKPFPRNDFVDLVGALLRPSTKPEGQKFQGTLSDLHMADIIQLKCMSGTTAAIEFTAPSGEKGRVYFENGQVRHATTATKDGIDAFNEIVTWKGGMIAEVSAGSAPQTIDMDWQILLMEAMRHQDEAGDKAAQKRQQTVTSGKRRLLVIDDSIMLLNFLKDVLIEAGYDVATAANAKDSLALAESHEPELILLDYVLPDMKGDEVTRRLSENPVTAKIPVVYMSGFGSDLRPESANNPNVIGSLNKPFTSDLLIKTVENHMPQSSEEPHSVPSPQPEPEAAAPEAPAPTMDFSAPFGEPEPAAMPEPVAPEEGAVAPQVEEWWSAPPSSETWSPPAATSFAPPAPVKTENLLPIEEAPAFTPAPFTPVAAVTENEANLPNESVTGGSYFCGDTRFFSLNWAMQTVAKGKLNGTLRCFWTGEPVDLLTRDGEIVLATTRDPELYCSEAPITLVNVEPERIAEARAQQREDGCPLFLTLAQRGLILQEPSVQLVQHYGQKLFAHLWTATRVRFTFEQKALPAWSNGLASEGDVDHWALATLRLIQFQDLGKKVDYDQNLIPAYTRDGFERVQNLRLTVAEAQFASQFNGARSIQQIAKNLRLDLKFARLTLFRFLALEIVECWPATTAAKPERKGVLQRLSRSIGMGD
jgi:DNA-binding response OmpR family regulator